MDGLLVIQTTNQSNDLVNDITFSHLADAFIQRDLQMRTIEAIKINTRAITHKCYNKSEWRGQHFTIRYNRLEPKTSWSLAGAGHVSQHHTHFTSVCTDQLQMCVRGSWDSHHRKLDPPALNWNPKPHKHSRAKDYSRANLLLVTAALPWKWVAGVWMMLQHENILLRKTLHSFHSKCLCVSSKINHTLTEIYFKLTLSFWMHYNIKTSIFVNHFHKNIGQHNCFQHW